MKSKTGQPASGYLTDNDNRIDNSWGHKSMSKKSEALKVGKDGYVPHPLALSKVTLSENLQSKVEMIAKNVHEVWAAKRIAEGWSYGAVRNDEHKLHPDICRYEDLPESEKEYDRATVETTLKALQYLNSK